MAFATSVTGPKRKGRTMTSPEDRLRLPLFGKRDVINHLAPLWLAKHWTKKTAEKRIEGFQFEGIGWYVSLDYALLVLPTTNQNLFHFYVFQHYGISTPDICKILTELPMRGQTRTTFTLKPRVP
jgi:hypothetical protein